MHYNFNIYRGRKMFNLNFSARTAKQAIADATDLVPNFAELRWILWYCPAKSRKWRKGIENLPNRLSQRQTRTTSHPLFTLTKNGLRNP
jgi:hypothetical protein